MNHYQIRYVQQHIYVIHLTKGAQMLIQISNELVGFICCWYWNVNPSQRVFGGKKYVNVHEIQYTIGNVGFSIEVTILYILWS